MRGIDQVAVTIFGDGAANRGAFHEGVNLTALWKLPVVFVCENNKYASGCRGARRLASGPFPPPCAAGFSPPLDAFATPGAAEVVDAVRRVVK